MRSVTAVVRASVPQSRRCPHPPLRRTFLLSTRDRRAAPTRQVRFGSDAEVRSMSAARLLYLQSRTIWSKAKMPVRAFSCRLAILILHEARSRCIRVRVLPVSDKVDFRTCLGRHTRFRRQLSAETELAEFCLSGSAWTLRAPDAAQRPLFMTTGLVHQLQALDSDSA